MADRKTGQVRAGRETQNCAKDICGQIPKMTCIRTSVFTMYFLREVLQNCIGIKAGFIKET